MAWHCWISGFLPPLLFIASIAIVFMGIWLSTDSLEIAIERFYDESPYGKWDIMCVAAG